MNDICDSMIREANRLYELNGKVELTDIMENCGVGEIETIDCLLENDWIEIWGNQYVKEEIDDGFAQTYGA